MGTNIYRLEIGFVAIVLLLSVSGFWSLYLGTDADPDAFHHLHAVTNFAWLALLLCQLIFLGKGRHGHHRTFGLAVLFFAPWLVATTALLSVRSAHEGLVSGRGDFLIVQNVAVTLELALLILLAFVLRKRRKLHGAFLLGTALLFMGIALFFTLISFVPGFIVEGPETFHRFATAGMTISGVTLVVGILFFLRDRRNGWPLLFAGAFASLNELIRTVLEGRGLIEPLTEFVGTLNQPVTFMVGFAGFLGLLAATGILKSRRPRTSGFAASSLPP